MNRQGHMNNTQHGFRSGRSCLSALLDVFDDRMHMISSDNNNNNCLKSNIQKVQWTIINVIHI